MDRIYGSIGSFLDLFCKSEQPTEIWHENDFSSCFEKVVIISPVYIIISLICSFYIFKASCSPIVSGNPNRAWVVYLRLLLHAGIVCTQIALFVEQCLAVENIRTVEIVAQSLVLLAWCLSGFVTFIWRRSWTSMHSGRDFDIIVASWFLALISCSFELHSAILSSHGSASALDQDIFQDYERYNIYIRWSLYVCVMLSQIPRSNVPVLTPDDEAGSSRSTQVRHSQNEDVASFMSRITLHWVNKLFKAARETQFPTVEHLPFDLPKALNPAANHCNLQQALNDFAQPRTEIASSASEEELPLLAETTLDDSDDGAPANYDKLFLVKSLNRAFGWTFWPLNLIKMLQVILSLSVPVILNLFLRELESSSPNLLSAGLYLLLLVAVSCIKAFVSAHLRFELRKLELRVKGSLISEMFSKVLNVNLASLKVFTVGQISNFATEDVRRISGTLYTLLNIWAIPLELIILTVLLYQYIHLSFLAAVGFCVLITPVNLYVTGKFEKHEEKLMKQRDLRLKMIHEIFSNIKTVKFFSWENHIIKNLSVLRNLELKELKTIAYLDAGSFYIWAIAPSIITALTITTYSLLGGGITVSVLFTTLALVDRLIEPLNSIPWVLLEFAMALVSIKRIQKFFSLPGMSPTNCEVNPPLGEASVIEVDNCSFYWKTKADCCLVRLQFQVNKGDLMVVMGKTGSGKSSLLLALSQELHMASGELRLKEWGDGAGLVLQDSWIKTGTVRETILDGCAFDLYWYETVVSACALDKDISNFPQGDETPVGPKGSALSGGQKHRLCLARAIYKNKQVYLIDDIFSSLDIHVVNHIFENCINGLLAHKTRVICTHNKLLTSSANTLMILEKGRVQYIGPPHVTESSQVEETAGATDTASPCDAKDADEPVQSQYQEPRSFGAVNFSVYHFYIKSAGYGLCFLVLCFLVLMEGTNTAATIWLSYWANTASLTPGTMHKYPLGERKFFPKAFNHSMLQKDQTHYVGLDDGVFDGFTMASNSTYYLEVYGYIIVGNSLFTLGRFLSFIPFQITATRILHNNMLTAILKAPLHFFDSTPLGVIINRFSSDVYTVDSEVPVEVNILFAMLVHIVGLIILTCYGLPFILISFLPLSVLYYFIQKYYRVAVRELKRLYSASQSPLFSHFEETLAGVSYIHGSRNNTAVQTFGLKILRSYQRTRYCLSTASVWLALRLELLTAFIIAIAASIILVEIKLGTANAPRLALGLTFILSISQALDYLVSSFADTEKAFVAAERLIQFTKDIPQEDEVEWTWPIRDNWPVSGSICFSAVSVRYNDSPARALSDVSFSVKAGEKVAIVGRTGAGKSTLLLALFKLVDIDHGSIAVDNVDISEINNELLRQRIAIIPQQALVFSATLRENVDPTGQYTDEEITNVLEQCRLGDFMVAKGGLGAEVSSGVLSKGECQLISLARVLLKKSNILCLDEATSDIDSDTDAIVQELLQNQFRGATMLTVAHKIDTVLHYDRVIVLGQGSILENDNPKTLLKNTSSHFYRLVQSSGLQETATSCKDYSWMTRKSLSVSEQEGCSPISPPVFSPPLRRGSFQHSFSRSGSSSASSRSFDYGSTHRSLSAGSNSDTR